MFRLKRRRRYIALVAILLMQICAGAGWDNAVCRGAACQSDYPIGPLPTYVRDLAFAVVGCLAANFLLFWIQYSIILLHLPWTRAAFYFDRRLFTVRCLVADLFPAVLFFVLAVVLFADVFPVTLVAIPPVFFAGDFWAVPVAFFPQSRADAMSAPARHDCSFAHTTSSVTHSQPANVPKPQSELAMTRSRSPTAATAVSMRCATTSGCSTKLLFGSITPGSKIMWSGNLFRCNAPASC